MMLLLLRARCRYAFLLVCCLNMGVGDVQAEEDEVIDLQELLLQVSKDLSAFGRDMKEAIKGFTTTMEELRKSSAQLTSSNQDIKESVDKSSRAMFSRLKDIEEVSTKMTASVQEVRKELEKASSSINSIAREQTFLKETLATVNNVTTEIHTINRELEDGGSKCSASIEAFLKEQITLKETLTEKIDELVEKSGTCEGKPDGDKAGEPNNNGDKDNENGDPDPGPPRDCMDIYKKGNLTSGVYTIHPKGFPTLFPVLCDMEEGGGWTVIQKRGDYGTRKTFLYKLFDEYRRGFGDFSKEFWLGNGKISAITCQGDYEVKFDLWDKDKNHAHARYNTFKVEGASTQYRLRVGGYSGTAGDALSLDDGVIFSAGERKSNYKCKEFISAGWWHGACAANPNGVLLHDFSTDVMLVERGIIWVPWKGDKYSLPAATIKVKPKQIKHQN